MTFSVKPGKGAKELFLDMARDEVIDLLGEPAVTRDVDGFERLSYPERDITVILLEGKVFKLWFGEKSQATCGPLKLLMAHDELPEKFTGVAEVREAPEEICYDVAGLTAFLFSTGLDDDMRLRGFLVLPRAPEGGEPILPTRELPDVPHQGDVNGGSATNSSTANHESSDGFDDSFDVAPAMSSAPVTREALDETEASDDALMDAPVPPPPPALADAFAADGPPPSETVPPPPPPPPPTAEEAAARAAQLAGLRTVDAPAEPDADDRRPMPKGGSLPINYLFVVKAGVGDDHVHLEQSKEAVIDQLGEPSGVRSTMMRFAGRGMELRLNADGSVLAITWCNDKSPLFIGPVRPAYVEFNGLRLGDPTSKIRNAAPHAAKEDDFEGSTGQFILPGLEIHHSRGEVVQFTVYAESGRPAVLDD